MSGSERIMAKNIGFGLAIDSNSLVSWVIR